MEDRRLTPVRDAAGMVIVHRPTAVSREVIETASGAHVVLRQDVIAHIATALALARQKTHPLQRPIVGPMIPLIFDVIPHPKRNLEQLVADRLRVVDAVLFAA